MTTLDPKPEHAPTGHALDSGEALERYGEPEFIAYDEPANADEIIYPNTWTISPANTHGFPEPVEEANPALFQKHPIPRRHIDWRGNTIGLVAGSQPIQLIAKNSRRLRITIWTDAGNTAPVALSPLPTVAGGGVGSGTVLLAPSSLPLVLITTGAFYVSCSAVGTVYYTEESLVSDSDV